MLSELLDPVEENHKEQSPLFRAEHLLLAFQISAADCLNELSDITPHDCAALMEEHLRVIEKYLKRVRIYHLQYAKFATKFAGAYTLKPFGLLEIRKGGSQKRGCLENLQLEACSVFVRRQSEIFLTLQAAVYAGLVSASALLLEEWID